VLVFFDAGSQISFVKRGLVDFLRPTKLGGDALDIYTFGSTKPNKLKADQYLVGLRRQDGRIQEIEAYETDRIGADISALVNSAGKLQSIKEEPDILIGVTDFWNFFRGLQETQKDMFIIQTTIGDIPCGKWQADQWRSKPRKIHASVHTTTISRRAVIPEDADVHEFWSLESVGIYDPPHEDEDEAAQAAFDRSIT
jgi:hypothetical protein